MARNPNGGGDNGGTSQAAAANQFQLLGDIQVADFSAHPPVVKPFGTTTLQWNVTVPTTLHVPVSIIVDGHKGTTTGSVDATLANEATFALTGATALVSRVVKTLTVSVDQSECKILQPVAASVLTVPLKNQIDQQFSGSSSFALRSGGSVVTPTNGGATVAIPLHLDVPSWFDADMDITIQLNIWMATIGSVTVQASSTDVHVTWTWLQDLAGCTTFGEKLSQAFMSHIVDNEVAPIIAQQINGEIQSFAATQQQNDPQHRVFTLTSFSFGPDGLGFTVCPHEASSTGGGQVVGVSGSRLTEATR